MWSNIMITTKPVIDAGIHRYKRRTKKIVEVEE